MTECLGPAQNGNDEILELTEQVQRMFDLWEEYARFRDSGVSGEPRRDFSAPRFFHRLSAAGLMHRMTQCRPLSPRRRSFPHS